MSAPDLPRTQLATTRDGLAIAYSTVGSGQPFVFVRGWVSHIELMWSSQAFRSFFLAIADHFQVVRYDSRGNGLSDRQPPRPVTLEHLAWDLETVLERVGGPAILYGQTFGGPVAIALAARRPELVDRLILDGTFASGADLDSGPSRGSIRGMLPLMRHMPRAAFQTFDYLTNPSTDDSRSARLQNVANSISGDMAAELYGLAFEVDVRNLLPGIAAPALVIHRAGNKSIPLVHGQRLAAGLPNTTFKLLPGSEANPWEGDPSGPLGAVADFLGVVFDFRDSGADDRTQLAVILFTDLESSTEMTERLGDRAAQEVLHGHNAAVRGALERLGGREIKHTGDGIMAVFNSALRAVKAALDIQAQFAAAEVRVRIGINAGEPIAEAGDYFGGTVQLAARVCSAAQPGDVLVTRVVRDLCRGKGQTFESAGEFTLRGFAEPEQLFLAVPQASAGLG